MLVTLSKFFFFYAFVGKGFNYPYPQQAVFYLGVNLTNALVLGLLGVPGFGLLLLLNWALAL